MAYKVGDTVVYGVHGVCRIEEMTIRNYGGKPQEYFLLKPVYSPDSAIFVPVGNEALLAKMRRVLSEKEIRSIISAMPDEQIIWVEDEMDRRDKYRQILAGGDRTELVRIIKALYLHQKEQQKKGRRLHITDERFMKDAEKMLYEEFAFVLNLSKEQVLPFIMEQAEAGEKQEVS